MATIDEAFSFAVRQHREGRLDAAQELYQRILKADPGHAGALRLSGVAARQSGDAAAAAARIARAIALQPDVAEAYINLGNALRGLARPAAAAALHRATILAPDQPDAHVALASGLSAQSRHQEAVVSWRIAAKLRPDHPESRNGLGNALQSLGRSDEAAAAYRSAIVLDAGHAEAHANLGTTLRALRRPAEAEACHRRALTLRPAFPAALSGRGLALLDLGRPESAATCQASALAVQPNFLGAWNNLGNALLAQARPEEAAAAFKRAIRLDPAVPDPHRNLGMALLLMGSLATGWQEYEWRFRCADAPTRANLPWPRWDGSSLHGRTILLHAEQGLGDVIQFVRYVPLVAARGGRVLLCVPRTLFRLLDSLRDVADLIPAGEPVPPVDVHCPLMSLPQAFGTTLHSIPASAPYLRPEPAQVAAWKQRLAGCGGLRVGLAWAGSPGHGNDHNRSLSLSALTPLAAVPGVRLFALQKGPAAAQAETPPLGMEITLPSPVLEDFADTAALAVNLDLIVTVDTSVAHLAGALGIPAWVLLPYSPDWRWMLHRDDTPWYPTLRLFRQERPGNWAPVLDKAARHLRILTGS